MFGLRREVIATYEAKAFGACEELGRTVNGRRVWFLTWSKGALEIRARSLREVSNEEIAASDMGGDDLIVIDPEDRPQLRVMLEVFFQVGERDGLPEAAAWLTRNGIGWSRATPAPRLARPLAASTARASTIPITGPGQIDRRPLMVPGQAGTRCAGAKGEDTPRDTPRPVSTGGFRNVDQAVPSVMYRPSCLGGWHDCEVKRSNGAGRRCRR